MCFSEKESISKRLLKHLMTRDLEDSALGDPDLRSFRLLETVVYLVDVYVQSGRYKTGLLYLQVAHPFVTLVVTCTSKLSCGYFPSKINIHPCIPMPTLTEVYECQLFLLSPIIKTFMLYMGAKLTVFLFFVLSVLVSIRREAS